MTDYDDGIQFMKITKQTIQNPYCGLVPKATLHTWIWIECFCYCRV